MDMVIKSSLSQEQTRGAHGRFQMRISQWNGQHDFILVDNITEDAILGMDFLSEHNVTLDFGKKQAIILDKGQEHNISYLQVETSIKQKLENPIARKNNELSINDELSEYEKQKVNKFTSEFFNIFQCSVCDTGQINVNPNGAITNNASPIEKEQVEKQDNEIQASKVQESQNTFSSQMGYSGFNHENKKVAKIKQTNKRKTRVKLKTTINKYKVPSSPYFKRQTSRYYKSNSTILVKKSRLKKTRFKQVHKSKTFFFVKQTSKKKYKK